MFSEEKIKQVFSAIEENGIDAFDDKSLAELLSILNKEELDYFESHAYLKLENSNRISRVRPLVDFITKKELLRIKQSDIYGLYIESLKRNQYKEFFRTLETKELSDLKKYIICTTRKDNVDASKKIITLITQEIKNKESLKKPCFN